MNDKFERMQKAAKEFEEALNDIGTFSDVDVYKIDIRRISDAQPRYSYSVLIRNVTTEVIYP